MSRVIGQARQQYKKALIVELGGLMFFFLLLCLWQWKSAVSFGLGFLSAFLPFAVFVLIVFFRKATYSTGMTAFYRGEAIKFGLTVICIIACFKLFATMNFIVFFMGYFVALILNNLLPVLIGKKIKS
ncbi:ATP synthase subunit I [Bisgaard Taxon 10/6]|uniref:ATP synthase subunit I n=1 Tax=Exercitatus varius TaxID=67857 RepID=A0ABT6ESE6_9PAST|nr:ATP synthase subunit I [Exercitatus varius]MDG2939172.1 ATP synthase subunit I [Exercitatus varius]MDG2946310.1 ATP synthase subunit I [Exercitatus varius]